MSFLGPAVIMHAPRGGTDILGAPSAPVSGPVCLGRGVCALGSSAISSPGRCCLYCVGTGSLTQVLWAPASQACHPGPTPGPAPSPLTHKEEQGWPGLVVFPCVAWGWGGAQACGRDSEVGKSLMAPTKLCVAGRWECVVEGSLEWGSRGARLQRACGEQLRGLRQRRGLIRSASRMTEKVPANVSPLTPRQAFSSRLSGWMLFVVTIRLNSRIPLLPAGGIWAIH